jgi:hypothetical protein
MGTSTNIRPYSLHDDWYLFRMTWSRALFCTSRLIRSLLLEILTKL